MTVAISQDEGSAWTDSNLAFEEFWGTWRRDTRHPPNLHLPNHQIRYPPDQAFSKSSILHINILHINTVQIRYPPDQTYPRSDILQQYQPLSCHLKSLGGFDSGIQYILQFMILQIDIPKSGILQINIPQVRNPHIRQPPDQAISRSGILQNPVSSNIHHLPTSDILQQHQPLPLLWHPNPYFLSGLFQSHLQASISWDFACVVRCYGTMVVHLLFIAALYGVS